MTHHGLRASLVAGLLLLAAALPAIADTRDGVGASVSTRTPPPGGTNRPLLTLTGEAPHNAFGISVAPAGDVNGDGEGDLVLGAPGYSAGDPAASVGRAYIYFGGSRADVIPDLILTGEATNGFFGRSVASAGDVNGDGYDDIVVGAFGNGDFTGRAYVYFGGANPDANPDLILDGEAPGDRFGFPVSAAGDVNGDRFADLIIGANGYNSFTGRAYVYFGGPNPNTSADLVLTGEAPYAGFASSVASAGDMNGDGFSDLIVGAWRINEFTGRAYVYFGGPGADAAPDLVLNGEAMNIGFGDATAPAGDVNRDGFSDVVIGALWYPGTFVQTGRAYVYFGGRRPDPVPDLVLTGEATANFFGHAVASAGDVNGDGYGDLIVGAYGYGSARGRAYVFLGGRRPRSTAALVLGGEAPYNYFGNSVGCAEGFGDIIVGADGYGENTGRAYVYDFDRDSELSPPLEESIAGPSGVGGEYALGATVVAPVLQGDRFLAVSPNPAGRGETHIFFRVIRDLLPVDLSIYDVTGRRVNTLAAGNMAEGVHTAGWDGRAEGGRAVAAGVYFLRLSWGVGSTATERLIVAR